MRTLRSFRPADVHEEGMRNIFIRENDDGFLKRFRRSVFHSPEYKLSRLVCQVCLCPFLRPLLEKIDTLDYTRKSRELKVAEEYAIRLMRPTYKAVKAKRVARQLVEKYPTHGFVIDSYEAG